MYERFLKKVGVWNTYCIERTNKINPEMLVSYYYLISAFMVREQTHSIVTIQDNIFLNEIMVEIYSKSLVRDIGIVLLMKFS